MPRRQLHAFFLGYQDVATAKFFSRVNGLHAGKFQNDPALVGPRRFDAYFFRLTVGTFQVSPAEAGKSLRKIGQDFGRDFPAATLRPGNASHRQVGGIPRRAPGAFPDRFGPCVG